MIDDNIIWYGQRQGLYKIDLNNLTSKKIFLDEPLHLADFRNYIQEINVNNDTLYVGTANGLYLLDKKTDNIIAKYLTDGIDIQHRESSNTVESIFINLEKDAIWVTLMKGLYRINKANDSIEEFIFKDAPYIYPHNFHSGKLYDNVLLMPSHGLGMVEFDLKTKKFSSYETNPDSVWNRAENVIRSAIELNDSLLFVNAQNKGNGLFNRLTKEYNWIETNDIMKEGVFLNLDRSGYIWASKRGRIFRTKESLVIDIKQFKHILDISSFKANDILKSRPSIEGYKLINLSDKERNLEIDFSITKPYLLDSIRYEYQLNSDKWKLVDKMNTFKLFDLPSGNNVIVIRALNGVDKVLAFRKLNVRINIPFYKSYYFIGLCFLALLTIFYLIINYINGQKITRKLQELDKAKSNFFANISHEFRTPLTLISGPIRKQLKRENLPEDDRHSFEMMDRNSSRLLSLVDQLLDISKIEAGSLKLRISKSEIIPFLGSLCDSFTFSAKQKHIDYVFYANETYNDTYFDKDIVEKIAVNLLSNAIKYTPNNGSIICNTIVKDNHMYFTIKNTGKGFSKEELKNIFERFYQINENSQGVGIGLALVKELVSLHKGKISVESVPNEWTTFEVVLPINRVPFKVGEIFLNPENKTIVIDDNIIEKSVTAITADAASEQINEESPILLIVDDNEDIRAYVTNLFKDNYTVLTAKNGQIGSELAIQNIPDIIISDIMMPIKNGIELCNTLKIDELTSHIPIILLTAKAGVKHKIEGLETGADDYITKPFNEELLKLRVEKLIESRRKLQERYSQEVILRPKDIAVTSIDEQFLERLQKVLDQKLVESSFNVEEFSKAVGMSRMQLHRKLKALTGLSATEFVRSQRLKLAAQLLKKSEINVSQVGYSVGFNDHAYFSKCFKEMYHCTPSEYIKTTKE